MALMMSLRGDYRMVDLELQQLQMDKPLAKTEGVTADA